MNDWRYLAIVVIVGAIGPTIASIAALISSINTRRESLVTREEAVKGRADAVKKIEDIHVVVNSQLSELLRATAQAAMARGVIQGKETTGSITLTPPPGTEEPNR